MLTGHIDESGSSRFFTLSCLVGDGSMWLWIELAWVKLLEETNATLKAQGRPSISRYHASDCRNLRREFAGWSAEEQRGFTQKIIRIFQRHPLHIYAYSVDLQVLIEEIPETEPNPRGFAYVVLLSQLMTAIGATLELYPKDQIALVHDRCDYDAALHEAFNHMKSDRTFRHRDRFTTLTSMSWEDCIHLQPADFLAYENFREAERRTTKRRRSKALELLLDLDSFRGRAIGFERQALRELRAVVDALDKGTKKTLFKNARITLPS
jgi:hypothetical protein